MIQNIIDVRNLSKSFDISSKEPGIKGTIKHFFRRQTKSLKVIKEISFDGIYYRNDIGHQVRKKLSKEN